MEHIYYSDCEHFRGDVPCLPHKEKNVHCNECTFYIPKKDIILIIKLGAIGDVIRTTPLLEPIMMEHKDSLIWWLTYSPEIVPSKVHKILPFNLESVVSLQGMSFRKVINLDKDHYACSLASQLKTDELIGFTLKDGKPSPANSSSEHKFLTGLFDDVNKSNTKNYLEEIFEICGYKFNGEEYILELKEHHNWDLPTSSKGIVGLNTGCGARWVSRLWSDGNWLNLINLLKSNGYTPLLLGGEQEHQKNKELSDKSAALYFGYFGLNKFISLVNECHLVVTAVTMGMHITIALKKKIVLLNNIFNKNEFELYGRGVIVEPDLPCHCFFSPVCKNKVYFCMEHLKYETVFNSIQKLMT